MVTTTIDTQLGRARWLRRSAAAAVATVVLGITGTGAAVGILSARQPDTSGGTEASTGPGAGDSGSSDSTGSGLGSAQQGAPAQGGSHGS